MNEEAFKQYAYTALTSRFKDHADFEEFYASLPSDAVKDEFLRVTSFYLFLVKQGDWQVKVDGSNPVIDYFINSFKLVVLFSLIESLSNERHEEFFEWLCGRDTATTFTVSDQAVLGRLFEEYKASFGSIRRCVAFFDGLPKGRKQALCKAIYLDGEPLSSIQKVAEFLYTLRSKFVHQGRLVLHVSEGTVLSLRKKKVVRTDLSIKELLEAFEEGVLAYFSQTSSKPS